MLRIYDTMERQVLIICLTPQLFYKEREIDLDFSFTTEQAGGYRICVTNYARTYTKIDVKVRSGVDAKNYDTLVTQKKLKPIELQAQKLEDMAKELKRTMALNLRAERELKRQVNKGSSATSTSGFVSIGIMILATVVSVVSLPL